MPTKEERKQLRKQKRAERKEFKKLKKGKFNDIVSAVTRSKIDIDLDVAEPKFVTAFNQVWPILKPILEYAEMVRLTGPGADKAIRIVIELGERISTGAASDAEESAFIGTLDTIWEPVKTVLGILATFTDDKVDEVLNKIVEIGDWITGE
jgi:hypothetical protein